MVMLMDGSNRLKAENVKNGEVIKILSAPDWVVDNYKQPDGTSKPTNSLVGKVEHNGKEIDLRFTKASRENLKEVFTNDTATWVGKSATITLVPTEKGKSIMLTPVMWEA